VVADAEQRAAPPSPTRSATTATLTDADQRATATLSEAEAEARITDENETRCAKREHLDPPVEAPGRRRRARPVRHPRA